MSCPQSTDHCSDAIQQTYRAILLGSLRSRGTPDEQARGKRTPFWSDRLLCSLILCEVDHLRHIADCYGHAVRDRLRHTVISTVRGALRATDSLISSERDTFLIVLPNTSLAGAATVAERLRALIHKTPFPQDDAAFRLTLSLGVVMVHPQDSPETLKNRVTRALSAATQSGGNIVHTEQ